ncbi:hypothetical protein SteCoe_1050 [Stentor coeruleus]|uniref:Uncharacterized protein n=1 Tax=Stentor coeruleus TaxID=5963 RepID=A0A1R2D2X2_9CILI|nr:hypothetical protein SteCoe_1050 [Stentor coeruleus]
MIRFNLKFVKAALLLNFAIGFTVIYIQCFGIGISGYSHDECGVYLPAWLIVAGCSLVFFAIFYALSVRYSGKSKSLTILYAIITGTFVLFNIFLVLVGDYTFSRFSSECSFKSYGTRKSRYVPYTSTIAELILFNITTVFGIILWVCMVYYYKKKGIHYFKKQETSEIQNNMNENSKANENYSESFNAKENCDKDDKVRENCDDDAKAKDNYDEMPKLIQNEKEI